MNRLPTTVVVMLCLWMGITVAAPHYALSYDNVPITASSWEEIDITWPNAFNRKQPNTAQLLRPIRYADKHGLIKGGHVHMDLAEFGVPNAAITVTAVKPLSWQRVHHIKQLPYGQKPVIGVFVHQTDDVHTYHFTNKQDHISTIHATPNHPFYVVNLHAYVPIGRITNSMQLVGADEQPISLVCTTWKTKHCGRPYRKGRRTWVYNVEVYQQHRYLVGRQRILAHNPCGKITAKDMGDYQLNPGELREGPFSPSTNGEVDNIKLYKFKAYRGNHLPSNVKRSLSAWSQAVVDENALARSAKGYANTILEKLGEPKAFLRNTLLSVAYRDKEVIGISYFEIYPSEQTIVSKYIASNPENLLGNNDLKISGFGYKLNYTGLKYLQSKYPSFKVITAATTAPAVKIYRTLGFAGPFDL